MSARLAQNDRANNRCLGCCRARQRGARFLAHAPNRHLAQARAELRRSLFLPTGQPVATRAASGHFA
eukprot:11168111-Lingulodinium_polyedra.AAC.1